MMNERDSFGSKFGILVALAGSAVGLGNLWRFPYLVGNNGGAVFIILYLLFLTIICLPLMITEFVVGRRSQSNVFGAFKVLSQGKSGKAWGKIGFISVISALVILSFYSVVGGWTVDYITQAVCFNFKEGLDYEQTFRYSSENAFRPLIFTLIFLLFTAVVVIMGVNKGIEKYTKVMMPLLFVMVIMLAIRSLTLKGAGEGVKFLFRPDWSKFTIDTVLSALGQSFFSLSIGCGTIITYASYVKRNENIVRLSTETALMDTLFALLAGTAIMPAVFAFGLTPAEGPGLVFVIIPQIFSQLPMGGIFAILFFVVLFFAALSSSISLLEVMVAYLIEEIHWSRKAAVAISSLSVTVLAVLCSLSLGMLKHVTLLGNNIFDFMDKLSANILLPVGGLLFVLFAGWKMTDKEYFDEITNEGSLHFSPVFLKILRFIVRFVAPLVIVLIMLVSFLK
ncbi:MAG: sodium-dependent transporter [Bacteroidales bacterium]|nr:sodium-dependent transporter [Bacteroidales bacterium]